eukprot:1367530-Amorphochlora_amoeboformis.AAC.1
MSSDVRAYFPAIFSRIFSLPIREPLNQLKAVLGTDSRCFIWIFGYLSGSPLETAFDKRVNASPVTQNARMEQEKL